MWRRSRDMEALAVAVTWVVNSIPLRERPAEYQDIVRSFPGYAEP